MFSLDYKALHHKYFLSGNGLVNQESPRTGVHLARHQLFAGCGLGAVIYVRNTFQGEKNTGVKVCLKLQFTKRKSKSIFAKTNDRDNSISIEVPVDEVIQLYLALMSQSHYEFVVISSNTRKSVVLSNDGIGQVITASVAGLNLSMKLNRGQAFEIAQIAFGVIKIHYPELIQSELQSWAKPHTANPNSNDVECSEKGETTSPIGEHQRKAIWAIANQKWPKRDLEAAKKMQSQFSAEEAATYITAANNGDFSLWDSFHSISH